MKIWMIWGGLVILLLLGGKGVYDLQLQQNQLQIEAQLTGIARLKADQVTGWRNERLIDADVIMGNRLLANGLVRWLSGESNPNVLVELHDYMEPSRQVSGYMDYLIVDAEGKIRLNAVESHPSRLDIETQSVLRESLRTYRSMMSDIHAGKEYPAPHLSMIVPLYSNFKPVGAIILFVDPCRQLFPILQTWPIKSQSAESQLIRRDGTEAYVFSAKHEVSAPGEIHHLPIDHLDALAVQAIQGKTGLINAMDDNGVKLIAVALTVPDSPWILMVKVNEQEVFKNARRETVLMGVGMLTLLALLSALYALAWQKRYERNLKQARDGAEAANGAKSQFLASMSHEIRTPMNAILGFAKLLEDEPLTEDQQQMVERINAAGRSLLSIINEILDFSKIEAGQLSIEQRPFKLAELLGHIGGLMGAVAQAKGLTLRLQDDTPLAGRLSGDALRIEQVLINLVGNALKFTEQGGVTLRVAPVTVTETTARLRFEIEDTGIGLSPDALERLFVPFTQAESGIARRFGGTGLGLSISKRLVELMGGHIGVESTFGVGSTFWFELPLGRLADAEQSATPAAQVKGPRLQGLRLLVVDDSPINLKLAERVLQREGAEVTLMSDGQQALDGLRAHPAGFDLVLMDIHMPVMDGLTATRAIREELGLHTLPVIALTAGVMANEKQNALDAGINDFLPKPMDMDLMATMIRTYCPPSG
jgi:signal transduction histidine kinase/CheY-like chemotaxis protein